MRIQTKLNKKSSFFDWRGILLGWIGKEGNKISLSFNNKNVDSKNVYNIYNVHNLPI